MTVDDIEEVYRLREAAYRSLKADLVTCRLPPGKDISVRRLVEQTNLGLGPIRAALTRLDHEGLIRIRPQKGRKAYQVTLLTDKSVADLFDIGEIMLPEIARCGTVKASAEQIERIRSLLDDVEYLFDDSEPSRDVSRRTVRRVGEAFEVLACATQNAYFVSSFRRLSGEFSRVMGLVIDSDADERRCFAAATKDWNDVLCRRDGEGAARISSGYIRATRLRCLQTPTRWPSIATTEPTLANSVDLNMRRESRVSQIAIPRRGLR